MRLVRYLLNADRGLVIAGSLLVAIGLAMILSVVWAQGGL